MSIYLKLLIFQRNFWWYTANQNTHLFCSQAQTSCKQCLSKNANEIFHSRSYKNGFVWQDLSENDFIYPSSGHEYVLKGTQMIEASLSFRSCETISTSSSKSSTEASNSSTGADSPATITRRSQSLNSSDYKYYSANKCEEFAGKATIASTQTEKKRRERKSVSDKSCHTNPFL